MDETYLINLVKERLCYVSLNFLSELEQCRQPNNPIRRDYVLPDYITNHTGFIRDPMQVETSSVQDPTKPKIEEQVLFTMKMTQISQVLVMNNERITVPELLFTPSDVGFYLFYYLSYLIPRYQPSRSLRSFISGQKIFFLRKIY